MWKYVKKYVPFAILAGLFMIGEVSMDLIQPKMMSQIVDNGVLGLNNNGIGDMNLIWKLGLQMVILVIIGGLCGSLNNVFVHITGQNIGNDIRKDCFQKIMSFSFPQMDKFTTGSLITRVTNDISQVQLFVSQFVRGMIRTFMLMFGSIFFMYQLNKTFGLIVIAVFPFIVGCLFFCLFKANPLFTKAQKELDKLNSIMQEDISGIRVIKACVREIYEKLRFNRANDELIKTQLKVLTILAFMNPVMNSLMYLVITFILVVGSFQVTNGTTTPGSIMACVTYITQLLHGILMLVMIFQNISRGMASWNRLKEVLNSQGELVDGYYDQESEVKGEIEFKDVSFAYPSSKKNVLEHLDFKIHQGETVAIIGPTGCGKTTLVNLIPRFYDIQEGSILVDGVDVRNYKQKALRDKVSIVLQKAELFSMSIKDNIAWGVDDPEMEDIQLAAQIAQADEFISSMKDTYESMVAERGMSLSGGQKQRISIARSIIKDAEIMIFDDATSALDLKTEAKLYSALQKYHPQSTKIIIAQRIASIRNADKIILLENGKIRAIGKHQELMETCQSYQEIYYSQVGKEEYHG
ncbi:MAG: ABC transporter ATP-binding protein [Traorella sp.]